MGGGGGWGLTIDRIHKGNRWHATGPERKGRQGGNGRGLSLMWHMLIKVTCRQHEKGRECTRLESNVSYGRCRGPDAQELQRVGEQRQRNEGFEGTVARWIDPSETDV